MNILKLQASKRLYFTNQHVAEILSISVAAARVLCTRYVKNGIFVRLKKNIYLFREQLDQLAAKDLFHLSNIIQTPSYVSFMTALSYYGVTTQLTRGVIEAVSKTRTVSFTSNGLAFTYSRIKPIVYCGFERHDNFFIATKEKALVDCCYFFTLKRYNLEWSTLDLTKISYENVRETARLFPPKTRLLIKQLFTTINYV